MVGYSTKRAFLGSGEESRIEKASSTKFVVACLNLYRLVVDSKTDGTGKILVNLNMRVHFRSMKIKNVINN